jgi:lysophospholipase L1-like esterase
MTTTGSSNTTKAVIVSVITLLVMLGIAEAGLRVLNAAGAAPDLFSVLGQAKPPLDTMELPGMFYAHQYSGYAIKPGYTRGNFERINSLGFRGEDISTKKQDGVYRVVAIGGSTTFGVYVPWQQSYPYYLQRELQERLGKQKVEVINAGMTGSTAAESVHRLFTQILPLEPDMVIIYHAYNDLFPRVFDNYQEDYYHWRKSDPNNPPGLTRFYLWRLALRALNPSAFHENFDLQHYVWKTENLPESDTARVVNFDNSSNDAFARNMEYMIVSLNAHDIQPVLATFAIHPDIWHWNDYFPSYVWEEGIKQNNDAIKHLASKHELPLVPFAEALTGPKQRKYYSDSIHMTAEGNEVKASVFADTVEPLIRRARTAPSEAPSEALTDS